MPVELKLVSIISLQAFIALGDAIIRGLDIPKFPIWLPISERAPGPCTYLCGETKIFKLMCRTLLFFLMGCDSDFQVERPLDNFHMEKTIS